MNINNQAQIELLPDFNKNKELKIINLITLKNMVDVSNLSKIEKLEELAFHGLSNDVEPEQFSFLKDFKHLKKVRFNFNTKEKNKQFEKFRNEILSIEK